MVVVEVEELSGVVEVEELSWVVVVEVEVEELSGVVVVEEEIFATWALVPRVPGCLRALYPADGGGSSACWASGGGALYSGRQVPRPALSHRGSGRGPRPLG